MRRSVWAFALLAALPLSACATSSQVQDAGNGVYLISAHAAPIRGGATGAQDIAYEDANKLCATKQTGTHAIVVQNMERDVYQGSFGGNANGFGGGVFASGNVNIQFRCMQ